MFIYNVRMNANKIFKIIFILFALIITLILANAIYRIFNQNKSNDNYKNCREISTGEISLKNYTNVLKSVHENIDDYINMPVSFTGYVYRVYDLNSNQFILARDMIISSDYQSVVVGFLCEYSNADKFKDNTWVKVSGNIKKGNYHGDIPILEIKEIEEVSKPDNEFVYPPDNAYVPTSSF